MYDKARGTRSQINLPGPTFDNYILENTRNMPDKDYMGPNIPESIQALLGESSLTSSVTGFKIENYPIKRSSSSLDAWADESNAAQSESVRAKKYFKLKTAEISKNLILTMLQCI